MLMLLLIFQGSFAQDDLNDPEYIKSVIVKPVGANRFAPVIRLGETLQVSFDDLVADEREYHYKLEHCNEYWESSKLNESEYIRGYASDRIRNYENSFNTLQPFTHYHFTIPNNETSIKISGNYKLSILTEDDEVVFERKFVVYESQVTVGVTVHKSRDISTINSKQSVEFSVNYPSFRIDNPKEELYTVILQNNNWQNAISDLKPQFFRGSQLLYKYNKETSFWAGNEFLYFDTKSIRNTTLNVARVDQGEHLYHTILYTDDARKNRPYTLNPDINGNFIVRKLTNNNEALDADYSWVHFSLKADHVRNDEKVFVHGNFNNWQLDTSNEMSYNMDSGLYETMLLLKQGFYNYQYVTVNENREVHNYTVDGSYYQTENDYTVLVYYKKFGSRYTKLIGVGFGNSEKLLN